MYFINLIIVSERRRKGAYMTKKICFIFLLISASISMCLMSNTYSRYVSDTTGNIDILFAKWQILVNQNDITTGNSSAISFEPVIDVQATEKTENQIFVENMTSIVTNCLIK